MPFGSAFAPIHTQPSPYAIPDVLRELVVTVLSSLPFQSTSHAISSRFGSSGRLYVTAFCAVTFCCPIHKPPAPSVITASALGYTPGDLNILVVFATRVGVAPRPLPSPPPVRSGVAPPCCARAIAVELSARPAARNSRRFMLMASPLGCVRFRGDVPWYSRRTLYHGLRLATARTRQGYPPAPRVRHRRMTPDGVEAGLRPRRRRARSQSARRR